MTPDRSPVVAVLDTGLGRHPWFPDEDGRPDRRDVHRPATCPGAHRRVTFGGAGIGVWSEPSRDPENTGVVFDDVNGLVDGLCGHGTFIAGIIRQRCPQAVILSVPVMASDGAAVEDDIVGALSLLLERHRAAKAAPGTIAHGVLDVAQPLARLLPRDARGGRRHRPARPPPGVRRRGRRRRRGAGNDATRARFFPAAFSVPGGDGLVGVGATNPDDRSVALFSNVGDWVTAHAPGAGIVSTVPMTLSGSLRSRIQFDGRRPRPARRDRLRRLQLRLRGVERHVLRRTVDRRRDRR